MLLKHAGLFFLADDEHRARRVGKETRRRRRRKGCVRAKGVEGGQKFYGGTNEHIQ